MKKGLKKITLTGAYEMYLEKVVKFKDRARRKEICAAVLFNSLVIVLFTIVICCFSEIVWGSKISHERFLYHISSTISLVLVLTFIPNISLCCRRSADINVNPIFAIILYLLPIMIFILGFIFECMFDISTLATFGLIALIFYAIRIIGIIILMFIPGKKGETKYGKDPKYFFFDESIDENMYEHIEYVVNQRKKNVYPYSEIKKDLINNKGLYAELSDVIISYVKDNYDELKLVF